MRRALEIAGSIAFGVLAVAVARYFFSSPAAPTGQLNCSFRLAANAPPVRSAYSSVEISRLDVSAQLSGRFEDKDADGLLLWQVEGAANSGGRSTPLSGALFLDRSGAVQGMMLYQDPPGRDGDKLDIATLDDSGILDTNNAVAYVRYASDRNKLAHPFRYACRATISR